MRPLHRTAALAYAVLLLAGPAAAGPVGGDGGEVQAGGLQQAPSALPEPMVAAPVAGVPLTGAMNPSTSVNAESAASPSAQAAEMIREAQAEAGASEARPATRLGAQSTPAPKAAQGAQGDDGLREVGKAAVQWLRESIPWLRKDPQDSDDGKRHGIDAGEWSASPLEGGKPGRGSGFASAQTGGQPGTSPVPPGVTTAYGNDPLQPGPALPPNIVREAIDFLRMVVEHPMSWLVLGLFVIGSYAVSKFDRRPK